MVVQRINGLMFDSNSSNEMKIEVKKSSGDKNRDSDEEKSTSQLSNGGVKSLDGKKLSPSSVVVSDEEACCANSEKSQIFCTKKCVLNMEDSVINCEVAFFRENMKSENDEMMIESPRSDNEDDCSRKRKRESMFGLLNWVSDVAKNPCDPVIGLVPEKSKWESYGIEKMWKQVLLVREKMYLQRHVDSSAEQSALQKNQRMHPSMYDDQGPGYNFRERLRCTNEVSYDKTSSKNRAYLSSPSSKNQREVEKSPSHRLETDELASKEMVGTNDSSSPDPIANQVRERVLLGSRFQAKVPKWDSVMFESESKWLGTRVWPLEKGNNKFLIERDRIGKGRDNSCGCQAPGSIICVNFHIAEKRSKLKLELCSAFDQWEFDKMGEVISTYWKMEEERKFKDTVRSNPPCRETCFWDEIIKLFPKKSRADLVSYYFNVFLLQRRAYQNRFSPDNIDSDDDESESKSGLQFLGKDGKTSPGPTIRSPNNGKSKLNNI